MDSLANPNPVDFPLSQSDPIIPTSTNSVKGILALALLAYGLNTFDKYICRRLDAWLEGKRQVLRREIERSKKRMADRKSEFGY